MSLKGNIISKSIEAYLNYGVSPAQTIHDSENIIDFCYSHKTSKNFQVFYGDEPAQNINRYAIAKKEYGKKLYYIDTKGSRNLIANGECTILINDLDENLDLNMIDKDFYINKANEKITSLLLKQKAIDYKSRILDAVTILRNAGMKPIPKDYKMSIKGFKNTDIKEDFDYENHPTIAVYTGPKVGILGFDIDYLSKVPENILQILLNSKSLTCWTDKQDTNSIFDIAKHKRFKVFFKFSSSLKDLNLLEGYGFEIFYGKPANIFGAYDFEKEYLFDGELKELPEELKNILLKLKNELAQKVKNQSSENIQSNANWKSVKQEDFCEIVEELLQEIGNNFKTKTPDNEFFENVVNKNSDIIYVTECPSKELHTIHKSEESSIYVDKKGKINIHCWHKSCESERQSIENLLNQKIQSISSESNGLKSQDTSSEKSQYKTEEELKTEKSNEEINQYIEKYSTQVNIQEIKLIKDLSERLLVAPDKSLTIIKAATGTGKT